MWLRILKNVTPEYDIIEAEKHLLAALRSSVRDRNWTSYDRQRLVDLINDLRDLIPARIYEEEYY